MAWGASVPSLISLWLWICSVSSLTLGSLHFRNWTVLGNEMISHWRTMYRKNPSLKAQPPLEQKRCPGGWRDKTRGWGAEAGGGEGGLWAKPKSWGTGTKLRKMAEVSGRQIKCCPGFIRDCFLYLMTHRQKTGTSELYIGKREEDGNSLDRESREEMAWKQSPEKGIWQNFQKLWGAVRMGCKDTEDILEGTGLLLIRNDLQLAYTNGILVAQQLPPPQACCP